MLKFSSIVILLFVLISAIISIWDVDKNELNNKKRKKIKYILTLVALIIFFFSYIKEQIEYRNSEMEYKMKVFQDSMTIELLRNNIIESRRLQNPIPNTLDFSVTFSFSGKDIPVPETRIIGKNDYTLNDKKSTIELFRNFNINFFFVKPKTNFVMLEARCDMDLLEILDNPQNTISDNRMGLVYEDHKSAYHVNANGKLNIIYRNSEIITAADLNGLDVYIQTYYKSSETYFLNHLDQTTELENIFSHIKMPHLYLRVDNNMEMNLYDKEDNIKDTLGVFFIKDFKWRDEYMKWRF